MPKHQATGHDNVAIGMVRFFVVKHLECCNLSNSTRSSIDNIDVKHADNIVFIVSIINNFVEIVEKKRP